MPGTQAQAVVGFDVPHFADSLWASLTLQGIVSRIVCSARSPSTGTRAVRLDCGCWSCSTIQALACTTPAESPHAPQHHGPQACSRRSPGCMSLQRDGPVQALACAYLQVEQPADPAPRKGEGSAVCSSAGALCCCPPSLGIRQPAMQLSFMSELHASLPVFRPTTNASEQHPGCSHTTRCTRRFKRSCPSRACLFRACVVD